MAGASSRPTIQVKLRFFQVGIDWVRKLLWVFFLIALPVTSFPYFPIKFGGDFIVRPLSAIPLIFLFLVFILPALFTRPLPVTLRSLLPFLLIGLSSSALSLLYGINSNFGVSTIERLMRGLLTLGMGTAIYFTVATITSSFAELRAALRWIYAGFAVALLWSSAQIFFVVHFSQSYFDWIDSIQRAISGRKLFIDRISGLTYEPNWFAEQITMLLLPWLLASVLNGYSVFKRRIFKLNVEWLLLLWSLLALIFTFSRAGLINLLVIAIFSIVFLRPWLRPDSDPSASRGLASRRILQTGFVILLFVALIYLTGINNAFISRIWGYWTDFTHTSLDGYLMYLGFGARIIYGETAFRIFETHPIFGVGVGNYAFFFEDLLSSRYIIQVPEVLRLLTQNADRFRLMTPKNLYIRILAETGLLGMGAFIVFLIAIAGCVVYLYSSKNREHRFWGTAGMIALISFLIAAFTFDSFAVPNMWVSFGLITAAAWHAQQENNARSGNKDGP